jgi:predicted TIM-barrel enzyme
MNWKWYHSLGDMKVNMEEARVSATLEITFIAYGERKDMGCV